MLKPRLDADHSFQGTWWYPDSPATPFPGVLDSKAGRIHLHAQNNVSAPTVSQVLVASTPVSMLHGTINGVPVTLGELSVIGSNATHIPTGGFALSQRFDCRYAAFGLHAKTPDFQVQQASVSFENLDNWAQQETFCIKPFPEPGTFVEIAAKTPTELTFSVDSIEAKIALSRTMSSDSMPSWTRAGVTAEAWLRVEPKEPQPATWFNSQFWILRLLMSVLLGQPSKLRAITGLAQDADQDYVEVWALVREPQTIIATTIEPSQIRFPLPLLQADSPNFLQSWFSAMNKAQVAVELFVGALTNTQSYPHQRFNSLVHALEALHRHTMPGKYMAESDYLGVAKTLTDALPTVLEPSHKSALKSRIKYGNEYSLSKRLNELCAHLSPELKALVTSDLKGFLVRVVSTRNYFTHWELEADKPIFPDDELPLAGWKLSRLLAILLLKVMGISDKAIHQRLSMP